MPDITSETIFQLRVTEKQLKIINLALGHLCFPEEIKPAGRTDIQEAWRLNKEFLEMRKRHLSDKSKSVEDALAKANQLEEKSQREWAEMH